MPRSLSTHQTNSVAASIQIVNVNNSPQLNHPILNKIKKNIGSRLADQLKKNTALRARIKYLESCKKYMASMKTMQNQLDAAKKQEDLLEEERKRLEDDVDMKVKIWADWERQPGECATNGGRAEEQEEEAVGAGESRQAEGGEKRSEIEVNDLDGNDQEGRIEEWLEEQHLLGRWREEIL